MTSNRLKALTLVATLAALLAIGAGRFAWNRHHPGLSIPDEKQAAVALLASKLSGPGYFAETPAVQDEGGPWISPDDAHSQFDRVIRERKLGTGSAEQLRRMIDQLIEPPPSRMVGSARINLVRLNLALDQIKQ